MFRSSKIAALVAAATIALASGAASAESFQSNGRSADVYHGDLNLAKSADQKELRTRIARAANRVCATTSDIHAMLACKAKTLANVQAPVAAAIARAETGERYADAGRSDVRGLASN